MSQDTGAPIAPKLFKVLTENARAPIGAFDFTEYLPKGEEPGAWTPEIADPQLCQRGYHLTTKPEDFRAVGKRVFVAEGKGGGTIDRYDGKNVYSSIRLLAEVRAPWLEPAPEELDELERAVLRAWEAWAPPVMSQYQVAALQQKAGYEEYPTKPRHWAELLGLLRHKDYEPEPMTVMAG